jgi:hypothetical protein
MDFEFSRSQRAIRPLSKLMSSPHVDQVKLVKQEPVAWNSAALFKRYQVVGKT